MNAADILWLSLFAVTATAILILNRIRFGDHLTPIGIYVGVNSLSIAAYHFRLLDFTDVGARSHLVVLISLLAFTGAVFLRLPAADVDRGRDGPLSPPSTSIFRSVAVLANAGWMLSLVLLLNEYGMSHLRANIWIFQKEFQIQYIGYLNLVGILVLPMYVAMRCAGTGRRLDLILSGLAITGLLLAGIKQYVVFSTISAIVVYAVLRPGRFRLRHASVVFAGIVGFFVVYDAVVDIFGTRTFPGSKFPELLTCLERPYLYLTGSWPAMEHIVGGDMQPQPIFGYITLQPLWKILGDGLGLIEPVQKHMPFIDIGAHGFNVYSFTGDVYWDYGEIGVGVVSFVIGWIGAAFYARARMRRNWGHVLLYGVFSYGLALSFFAYYYRFGMLLLLFVVASLAFIVEPMISRKAPYGR